MAKKAKEVKVEETLEQAQVEESVETVEAAPVEEAVEETPAEVEEVKEVVKSKDEVVNGLVEAVKTQLVNLGYANPTKKDKEFCVDFVAKSNPELYTAKVVDAAKASL